jgi:hypothetical protein
MSQRALVIEDFADKVGEVFAINEQNIPAIPLTLAEAQPLNAGRTMPGARPPFSLIFLARDPRVLPQRLYRIEHNGLGEVTIFLVPIGKSAEGVSYEATFN